MVGISSSNRRSVGYIETHSYGTSLVWYHGVRSCRLHQHALSTLAAGGQGEGRQVARIRPCPGVIFDLRVSCRGQYQHSTATHLHPNITSTLFLPSQTFLGCEPLLPRSRAAEALHNIDRPHLTPPQCRSPSVTLTRSISDLSHAANACLPQSL